MSSFSKAKRDFCFYPKSTGPGPGDYDPQLPPSSSHAPIIRERSTFPREATPLELPMERSKAANPLPSVSRIFARPLTKKESSQADVTVNTGLLRFTQSEDISGRMEATELASLKQQLGLKTSESSSLAIQLKEAEGRIGELEEASNVLQEQLNRTRLQIGEQSKKQEELESEHAQKLEELEDEKKRIEEEKRRVEEELEDAVLEVEALKGTITEKKKNWDDIYAKLKNLAEQTGREKKELEEELHGINAKLNIATQQRDDSVKNVKLLQEQIQKLEGREENFTSTIESLQTKLYDVTEEKKLEEERLGAEFDQLKAELKMSRERLQKEVSTSEKLQQKLEELENQQNELFSTIAEKEDQLKDLETELHQLTETSQRQKEDLEKELDCVKNELEVAVLQRDEEARGAKEFQVKLENLESHRVDLEARECSLRDLLNQLEKECESLKGNLCRAEERIGKQAKEIEYQEGMMRSQAESILDLEEKNEVLSGKYEDLDSSIQARDMKIDNLMSDLNDAKVELATARETIENLDTKTEELNAALVHQEAEWIDTLERRMAILIPALTEKDAALEDQRRELLDERDTQKDLCQKLSTLEHKLEEIVLEKDAVIADLTQKFDGATEENLKLKKENQHLTDKMSALSTDYLSLSSQYEETSSNASFFKEQYQTTDREYRISQENVKMLEGTIDDLQQEKEELQETVTDLEDKIDTYRISLDDLEVELGCARTEKKGLLEEVSKLETALKELTSEKDESIRDLEGKISKLDHEKKSVTAEVQDLRERLSDAEKEIEGLGAERDRLEEEKEKASRESLAMSIAMDELREDGQREILKRDEEKEEVKRILEATVREKRCLGERVHELLEKQEEMKRKQEATDEDLIVMQELRDALDLDNEEMKSELEVVKKTLEKVTEDYNASKETVEKLQSSHCQLVQEHEGCSQRQETLKRENDELESCFQGLGKDLDGAYETIAKLKREVQQLKKEKADEIADYSKLEKRCEEVEAALDEKRTELYVANTQRAGMVQDLEKFRERYSMLVGHNNPKQKIQHMNILSKEFIELKQLALRYRAQYEAAKDVIRDMKVELNRLKGRKRFNLEDAFQHDDAEESAAAGRLTFCKEEKENEMGTSTKTNQRRFDPSKAFQHHEKRTPLKGNRAQ